MDYKVVKKLKGQKEEIVAVFLNANDAVAWAHHQAELHQGPGSFEVWTILHPALLGMAEMT